MQDDASASPRETSNSDAKDEKEVTFDEPVLPEDEQKFSPYELQRIRRWITCISLVDFDLTLGQTMRMSYPPGVLSTKEEHDVCCLSFPDSHSVSTNGDTTFCFRFRRRKRKSVDVSTATFHDAQTNGASSEAAVATNGVDALTVSSRDRKSSSFAEPPDENSIYQFGFVLFRQRKDDTRARGYFQQSIVIVSPLPLVTLFEKCASLIGTTFFSHGEFALETACRSICEWSDPEHGARVELPLLGTVLRVELHLPPEDTLLHTNARVARGSPRNGDSIYVPPRMQASPRRKDGSLDKLKDDATLIDLALHIDTTMVGGYFQEMNLYHHFRHSLGNLWFLWELVITGQPLLVASKSPAGCAHAVLGLASLISPILYRGDFRPYFTIYDADFKHFSALHDHKTLPPVLIGVTNPFFLKAWDAFPNILFLRTRQVSSDPHETSSQSTSSNARPPLSNSNAASAAAGPHSPNSARSANSLLSDNSSSNSHSHSDTNSLFSSSPTSDQNFESNGSSSSPAPIISGDDGSVDLSPSPPISSSKNPKLANRPSLRRRPSISKKPKISHNPVKSHEILRSVDKCKLICKDTPLVEPHKQVLSQLLPSRTSSPDRPHRSESEESVLINNMVLRKHFRDLTTRFLKPFEDYFTFDRELLQTPTFNPYLDKPRLQKFDEREFLQKVRLAPKSDFKFIPLRTARVLESKRKPLLKLYERFFRSPHFYFWFNSRRERAERARDRALYAAVTNCQILKLLEQSSIQDCVRMADVIKSWLNVALSRPNPDASKRGPADPAYCMTLRSHLKAAVAFLPPAQAAKFKRKQQAITSLSDIDPILRRGGSGGGGKNKRSGKGAAPPKRPASARPSTSTESVMTQNGVTTEVRGKLNLVIHDDHFH